MPAPRPDDAVVRPAGLRLVILYKLVRGTLALVLAAALAITAWSGHAASLRDLVEHLRHHHASALGERLGDALVRSITPRHIEVVAAALTFDGLGTLFEGYALRRGWWWAPWLVVAATLVLVPFELAALWRRIDAGRVALLVVNVVIAAYLVAEARRHGATRDREGP